MDDKFLESLKSFTVQDLLDDQRPTTSRLTTARGGRTAHSFGIGASGNGFLGGIPENSAATSLSSGFGQNKPKTAGRVRTSWGARPTSSMGNSFRPGTSRIRTLENFDDDREDFIPDLNELEEEDFAMMVASAPRAESQRISSLSELDAEMVTRKAFTVVRNVDLRKLTKFLLPEKYLIETPIRPPANLSTDPNEAYQQCIDHLSATLFTDISTTFDEKRAQGDPSTIWDDEGDEGEPPPLFGSLVAAPKKQPSAGK